MDTNSIDQSSGDSPMAGLGPSSSKAESSVTVVDDLNTSAAFVDAQLDPSVFVIRYPTFKMAPLVTPSTTLGPVVEFTLVGQAEAK